MSEKVKLGFGGEAGVGDVVGFKSDIEQYAEVIAIETDRYRGPVFVVKAPPSGFQGEYIRGLRVTKVDAADCWE